MAQISVEEASGFFVAAMRNPSAVQAGVCPGCRTFVGDGWTRCYQCNHQLETLDAVVPITYSVNLGQMHTALRNYKDGYGDQTIRIARAGLAAILWRFLELHERCVASAAGVDHFDLVTTVPSSDPGRDRNHPLRTIAAWCRPIADRLDVVLEPTGTPSQKHGFAADRYLATRGLDGADVLLIDDTWTTGGNARSAATTLKDNGARKVAAVVIGRHINPDWQIDGVPTQKLIDELPRFSWEHCCVDPCLATEED